MTTFWRLRIYTMVWGFLVVFYFTGRIDFTGKIFVVQVLGNTVIMWWVMRQSSHVINKRKPKWTRP